VELQKITILSGHSFCQGMFWDLNFQILRPHSQMFGFPLINYYEPLHLRTHVLPEKTFLNKKILKQMLENAIYTWVYEKNRLKQTQQFYEISINQQQATLKHLGYICTLKPRHVVRCGLVATVRACRISWELVRSTPAGLLSKICKTPSIVEILFYPLHQKEPEFLRATALNRRSWSSLFLLFKVKKRHIFKRTKILYALGKG